jgi:hypothetical protein
MSSAKAKILDLLTGYEASRIRFSFPVAGTGSVVTINHLAFARVARAIRHGHIKINVTTSMPSGVGAQYHSDTDTIDVKSVIGRADGGLVLHECTHAWFDITSNPLKALDDEAASYVVDGLYYRMTGLTPPRWNGPPHPSAGVVAGPLLQAYQIGSIAMPVVAPAPWAALRVAIMTTPPYTTGPAGTGGSYLRNGVL